jgi:hypothetical protein
MITTTDPSKYFFFTFWILKEPGCLNFSLNLIEFNIFEVLVSIILEFAAKVGNFGI